MEGVGRGGTHEVRGTAVDKQSEGHLILSGHNLWQRESTTKVSKRGVSSTATSEGLAASRLVLRGGAPGEQ